MRLTEKDNQGNWCVKGLPWKNLYVGTPITEETRELLYGALCKLKDYEDTGLSPDEVETVNDFTKSQIAHLLKKYQEEKEKHEWIPCSERLPKDNEMSEYYDAVIVTLDDGRVVNGCYRNRDEEWWVDAVDGEKYSINATDHVIAWQPLPEPYKGE